MPVKIRLTRMGKKKQPTYRVVVVDSRKPRDGAYIEQIGRYDPRHEPSIIEIDNDLALKWLQVGAQPTDRARKLLEISGAWARFRVARGDIHTIADAAPPVSSAAVEELVPEAGAEELVPEAGAEELVPEAGAEEPVPEGGAEESGPEGAPEKEVTVVDQLVEEAPSEKEPIELGDGADATANEDAAATEEEQS